jgi:glutaminyl-tRNA synthetase
VTKSENNVELAFLENCIRENLEPSAKRVMGVLNPLKVVIENYPDGKQEQLTAPNHPKDESMGNRQVPFTREVFIDRDDFRESANRKYKRLVTGGLVRLRYAYVIECTDVIKDASGEVSELRCRYDPQTLGKNPAEGKVRGVIHWVSANRNHEAEVRLFAPLFSVPNPDIEAEDNRALLNPDSLVSCQARVEEGLIQATLEDRYQFEREGYFCIDAHDSTADKLVFNRIVGLRDSWAKAEKRET